MKKIFYTGTNFDLTKGIGEDYLNTYSNPGTPGFKFTMSPEVASIESTYTEKTPYFRGENVTPVKLKIKNPIYINKKDETNSKPFKRNEIINIINNLNKLELTEVLNDYYGEVEVSGFSKLFNEAISGYMEMPPQYALQCIKNDFFSDYSVQDFLTIISKNTQYDSIVKEEVAGHINVFVFSNDLIYSAIDKKSLAKQEQDEEQEFEVEEEKIINQTQELIEAASSYKTFEEFKKDVLFHGTSEFFEGKLEGGGYDGIVWSAESNDIAQNYIALADTLSFYNYPEGYEADRLANVFHNENSFDIKLLKEHGYDFVFTKDERGEISSVSCTLNGREAKLPRKKDIAKILTEKLHYPKSSYMHIKQKYNKAKEDFIVAPYSYKKQGRLYILLGKNKLKIEDKRMGYFNEDNPQYNDFEGFKRSINEGYDAVIIDDVAQSTNHGNTPHDSHALFPSALEKLKQFIVPAKNYDWDTELTVEETIDFSLKDVFKKSRKLIKKDKHNITYFKLQ